MFEFLQLLVLIWLVKYTHGNGKVERIAGGTKVYRGQFPYFAQLYVGHFLNNTLAYGTTCGATLIDASWILTAAHCFKNSGKVMSRMIQQNRMIVFMGMEKNLYHINNESTPMRHIERVFLHPYYFVRYGPSGEIDKARSDVAIARLKKPFEYSKYIQQITLPHERNDKVCKRGIIIGAGKAIFNGNHSEDILYAEVKSKTLEDVGLPAYMTYSAFYSWVFWLEGHAMEGDSGGPFVCLETKERIPVQYGITSFIAKIHRSSVLTQYETVSKHMWFIKKYVPNVKVYRQHRLLSTTVKPISVKVQQINNSSVTLRFSIVSLCSFFLVISIIYLFN